MIVTAIIIEDEFLARKTLKSYLRKYFPSIRLIAEFDSIVKSKMFLKDNPVHIIFIDVQLKDGIGTELLQQIDTSKYKIVFTTAYEEYALEAFKFKAFGYLLKPIDPLEFKAIMNRVIKDISTEMPRSKKIKIPKSNGHIWININVIIRCESESNYTKIHCQNETYTVARTLKYVEGKMINDDQFIRVHQSHLLNKNFIKKSEILKNSIELEDGTLLPVARSKKSMLIEMFGN
ncbi:MAG: response regulator transcription factor [Flavobacteriales bacterium]|nr:response regulator transcription factor [Flavobacteriales bacterium]